MTADATSHYDQHRQRGFAGKKGDIYQFSCICGWESGYLPSEDGNAALLNHIEDPTEDCR